MHCKRQARLFPSDEAARPPAFAGSRCVRRPRRFDQPGPPQRFAAGHSSTFHRRKVDRKAAGGPLHQGRNAPRNPRSPVYKMLSPAPQPRVCRGASLFLKGSPVPPQVLPPSDEGGGKPEGLDGGRDTPSLLRSGDAQRKLAASSLPQSPAATAPSSEGAKGLGYTCGQAPQREPSGWAMPAGSSRRGSQGWDAAHLPAFASSQACSRQRHFFAPI